MEIRGLVKRYGATTVLHGVDLSVPTGSVLALLGPNGAGKTTTVRVVATLLVPDAGQVRLCGLDAVRDRRRVRRLLGLTGQSVAVDDLQTGTENLRMVGELRGLGRRAARARADELLERFDLAEAADRRVGTWSGGMRRRLDLAAGLVVPPRVLLLDEPTTGLDPRSRQAVWDAVTDLVAAGTTVLLTTQYLEEADRLADTVAVLDGGRVVALGTPSELKEGVGGARLELVLADAAAFERVGAVLGSRTSAGRREALTLDVPTDGSAGQVRALLDEVDPDRRAVARFAVRTATLDDVFLSLTGHAAGSRTTTAAPEEALHV